VAGKPVYIHVVTDVL